MNKLESKIHNIVEKNPISLYFVGSLLLVVLLLATILIVSLLNGNEFNQVFDSFISFQNIGNLSEFWAFILMSSLTFMTGFVMIYFAESATKIGRDVYEKEVFSLKKHDFETFSNKAISINVHSKSLLKKLNNFNIENQAKDSIESIFDDYKKIRANLVEIQSSYSSANLWSYAVSAYIDKYYNEIDMDDRILSSLSDFLTIIKNDNLKDTHSLEIRDYDPKMTKDEIKKKLKINLQSQLDSMLFPQEILASASLDLSELKSRFNRNWDQNYNHYDVSSTKEDQDSWNPYGGLWFFKSLNALLEKQMIFNGNLKARLLLPYLFSYENSYRIITNDSDYSTITIYQDYGQDLACLYSIYTSFSPANLIFDFFEKLNLLINDDLFLLQVMPEYAGGDNVKFTVNSSVKYKEYLGTTGLDNESQENNLDFLIFSSFLFLYRRNDDVFIECLPEISKQSETLHEINSRHNLDNLENHIINAGSLLPHKQLPTVSNFYYMKLEVYLDMLRKSTGK